MTASKVGDKCWVWNINSRVRDAAGNVTARGHFRESAITGETRISWIVGNDKFNKADGTLRDPNWSAHSRLHLTEKSVDDYCFVEEHRYKISEAVRRMDADTLRKVAALIGYEVAP